MLQLPPAGSGNVGEPLEATGEGVRTPSALGAVDDLSGSEASASGSGEDAVISRRSSKLQLDRATGPTSNATPAAKELEGA